MCVFAGISCGEEKPLNPSTTDNSTSPELADMDRGGMGNFKVPVPEGYKWEITQSWGSHCEECEQKYPSSNPTERYCVNTHVAPCCKYGWDFNLPGSADRFRPILASGDGVVKQSSHNSSWGYFVVLDHGNGICTRYAHMEPSSSDHLTIGQGICQGFVIGEIGQTGNAKGYHLHFQFEDCDTGISTPMAFSDGNGVPKCTMGNNVLDSNGKYNFLTLSNTLKLECNDNSNGEQPDESLPSNGWINAGCGPLFNCPMNSGCNRTQGFIFPDAGLMSIETLQASSYLYGECAVDGKTDGRFSANDNLTRAEALKSPLTLFDITDLCSNLSEEEFLDVDREDWFYSLVACALNQGLIQFTSYFHPDAEISFAEAAKIVVSSAVKAGVIKTINSPSSHFTNIGKDHWAYQYVETLYQYGGLSTVDLNVRPDSKVSRGKYAEMVASMSPCFCGNAICTQRCRCDQELYSCRESTDNGNDSGGPTDPTEDRESSIYLELSCEIDSTNTRCEDATILYVKCSVQNSGEVEVKLNDLVMSMTSTHANDPCEITDSHLRSGVAVQSLAPHTTQTLNGHFEISCQSVPSYNSFQAVFDLMEKISGETFVYEDFLETEIEISEMAFSPCEETISDGDTNNPPNSDGDVCVPLSCSDIRKECGTYSDECGGRLNCGSCPEESQCIDGVCLCILAQCGTPGYKCGFHTSCTATMFCGGCPAGKYCENGECVTPPCTPQTCQQMRYTCGTQSDGCNGTVSCGSCNTGLVCEEGVCVNPPCIPKTCQSLGLSCGQTQDTCGGFLQCGQCPSEQFCDNGICADIPCQPKTCSDLLLSCGYADDTCGNILNCGTCQTGFYCNDTGYCAQNQCTPLTCGELGYTCGSIQNGCGMEVGCGVCADTFHCDNGRCVANTPDARCSLCRPDQVCENGLCMIGFWGCNPEVGYALKLYAYDAEVEVLYSGTTPYEFYHLSQRVTYGAYFDCNQLPAALLIHGKSDGATVWILDPDLPPFSLWIDFIGTFSLTPPTNLIGGDPMRTATINIQDTDIYVHIPYE